MHRKQNNQSTADILSLAKTILNEENNNHVIVLKILRKSVIIWTDKYINGKLRVLGLAPLFL